MKLNFNILILTAAVLLMALHSFAQNIEDGNTPYDLPESASDYCFTDSAKVQYYSNFSIRTDSSFCSEMYCEIFDWIGVKYAYGKGSKNGTDCSRFVMNVTKELLGYELEGGSATIYNQCEKVEKDSLQEFDLVFFRIRNGHISHVGVYLQNGYFAHSSVQRGVIISHLEEPYYKKYFAGGGRVPAQNPN